MPRHRKDNLPPYVRVRHGSYHFDKPGVGSRKLCRVSDGIAAMHEALGAHLKTLTTAPTKGMPLLCEEWKRAPGEFGLGKYRPKVRKEYERMLKHIAVWFANFNANQVKPHHVATVLDTKFHDKPRTANAYRALLSLLFKFGNRRGLVAGNPCSGDLLSTMREGKRSRYITDDEIAGIKASGDARLGLFIDLAIITGQRVGDLIALEWRQISEKGIIITQGKEGATVAIAMSPQLKATLDGLKGGIERIGATPVLRTQTGDRYTYSGLHSAWRRACVKAKVENAHIHDLRRKSLTDAAKQLGKDAAQALAGHKSMEMTARYLEQTEIQWVEPVRLKA